MSGKEDEILDPLRDLEDQVDDMRNGSCEPPSGVHPNAANGIASPNDLWEQNQQILRQQDEILAWINRHS